MFAAIALGNLVKVQELLNADPKAATAKLISHKEDLISDEEFTTPLHLAVLNKRYDIAKLLLDYGADPNQLDFDEEHGGRTPLNLAAANGDLDMAKLLVARGSQVNLRDEIFHVSGRSPLHYATLSGNAALVRFLLDEGADPGVEDNHFKTACHYAAGHGFIPILEMLLDTQDGKVVLNRRYEGSPLHEATQSNHVTAVKVLLRAGAHIDPPEDVIQTTPLHLAARLGHHELVQLLVDHGADTCKRYEFPYESPLQIATVEGHEAVVLVLLNYMTDVSLTDRRVLSNSLQASRVLETVERSIKVAAGNNRAVVIYHLLRHYRRLLNVTASESNSKARLPERYLHVTHNALYKATTNGHLEVVRILVTDFDVDVNYIAKDQFQHVQRKKSVLYLAVVSGYKEIARLLLENGADPNTGTKDLLTPLHIAAHEGDLKMAKKLIKYGANVNSRDLEANETPLFDAARAGHADVVKLLIERGADIYLLNHKRQAAWQVVLNNKKLADLMVKTYLDAKKVRSKL